MLVDFGHNGYNIVSFSALKNQGHPCELGIAFVSLPDVVWPAVAMIPAGHEKESKLVMEYVAGPRGTVYA